MQDKISLEELIKFSPARLPKLLAHNIKRNSMIGVSADYGFTKDVMKSYYEKVDERDKYDQVITYLESYITTQIESLRSFLILAQQEKDLTEKKLLLIDIMELEQDIKRLLAFNGGV